MTYLLTEVALGILGYNFYDINGVPGSPNLSEGVHIPLEEAEYKTRQNLTELMKVDYEKSKIQEKTKEKIFCNVNGTVVELSSETADEDANKTTAKEQPDPNSTCLSSKEKKLIKLFNFGRAKLREQIRRHKSEYVFKPCPLEKDFSKVVTSFIQDEKEKLKQELKVIVNFRKATENAVKSLDEDLYNKYTSTFKISAPKVTSTTLSPDDLSSEK